MKETVRSGTTTYVRDGKELTEEELKAQGLKIPPSPGYGRTGKAESKQRTRTRTTDTNKGVKTNDNIGSKDTVSSKD